MRKHRIRIKSKSKMVKAAILTALLCVLVIVTPVLLVSGFNRTDDLTVINASTGSDLLMSYIGTGTELTGTAGSYDLTGLSPASALTNLNTVTGYTGSGSYLLDENADFVALGIYSQFSDCSGMSFNISSETEIPIGIGFYGIGCATYPFEGTVTSTYNTTLTLGSCPALFNYLSSGASLFTSTGSAPSIVAGNSYGTIAQVLIMDGNMSAIRFSSISGTVANLYDIDSDMADTGGLFGRITNNLPAATRTLDLSGIGSVNMTSVTVGKSGGNAGGLIGVADNIALELGDSFSFSVTAVKALGGDAGGVIGLLNGSVTFPAAFSLTGSISTDCTVEAYSNGTSGGNAGGIIGSVADGSCINGLSSITISYMTVNGGATAGGVFGKVGKLSVDSTYGAANISSLSLSGDGNNGGYIGELNGGAPNGSGTGTVTLSGITVSDTATALIGTEARAGGIIGYVNMAEKSDSLSIAGTVALPISATTVCSAIMPSASGEIKAYGGIIGAISESTYCRIDGAVTATADSSTVSGNDTPTDTAAGAAVGEVESGGFLDLGTASLNHSGQRDITVFVGKTGIGSVVRLTGTLSVAGGTALPTPTILSIVGEQNSSLIFTDSGFSFATTVSGDDIGNYGQIVRNENAVFSSLITFNGTTHTVSVAAVSDDGEIDDVTEFAALSIALTSNNAFGNCTLTLSSNITLNADINLTGTGIESLSRTGGTEIWNVVLNTSTTIDDFNAMLETVPSYSGTFDGNGKTVTLDIGRSVRSSSHLYGAYSASAHLMCGLFGSIKNATFTDLTINGTLLVHEDSVLRLIGGIAGFVSGGSPTIERCTTNLSSGTGISIGSNWYGGFIGFAVSNGMTITDSATNINFAITGDQIFTGYAGGFAGYIITLDNGGAGGGYDFSNATVAAKLSTDSKSANLAGVVGHISAFSEATSTYTADIVLSCINITADTVISNTNTTPDRTGNLIGVSWSDVYIHLDGTALAAANIGGKVINTNATNQSGLFDTVEGVLAIGEHTEITATLQDFTGGSVIVRDGSELLLIVDMSAANMNPVGNGFKAYFVLNNTVVDNINGGIVSIGMGDDSKVGVPDISWQAKLNSKSRSNAEKRRYYFNVGYLFSSDQLSTFRGNGTTGNIANEGDLMLYHLISYGRAYWRNGYIDTAGTGINRRYEPSIPSSYVVDANLNLSGKTFYSTYVSGSVTVNFNNKNLTFGPMAPDVFTGNQFTDNNVGLFNNVNGNLQISNLTLAGDINIPTMNAQLYGGSGAIVCGTMSGGSDTSNTVSTLILNNITLGGISVNYPEPAPGASYPYAPLLINRINNRTTATITGIRETSAAYSGKAASSLFGNVGSGTATRLSFTLTNIVLDGADATSIFTNSTLFYNILYNPNGTSSFNYNFNIAEDWDSTHINQVTYGSELEDQETQYYDVDYYVNRDTIPTAPGTVQDWSEYLPYVKESGQGCLFGVNIKSADLIEGWGTYKHPYVIGISDELYAVYRYIAIGTANEGWQVNYPADLANPIESVTYTMTSRVLTGDDGQGNTITLTVDQLRQWLCGAYFKIDNSINLSSKTDYTGIGTAANPFHGVIVGSGSGISVTVNSIAAPTVGYGFVNVANGCVVKDLTLEYSGTSFIVSPIDNSYFGGVIGKVIGGDNIIDNVSIIGVSFGTTNPGVSVDPGNRQVYAGGYVGYVEGGGVVFRMDSVINTTITGLSNYFYVNPYVGRVYDGYAINEGSAVLNNSESDYVIPTIGTTANDVIVYSYAGSELSVNLKDAEQLFLFSAAINSGSLSLGSDSAYSGVTRGRGIDAYDNVGDPALADETIPEDTVVSGRTPYLLLKYFNTTATDNFYAKLEKAAQAKTPLNLSLSDNVPGNTAIDMSPYGIGFRGLGGESNSSTPTVYIKSMSGTDDKVVTVTLNMVKNHYSEPLKRLGLIPTLYEQKSVNISNITITGTVKLMSYNKINGISYAYNTEAADGTTSYCGGLIGCCSGYNANNKIILENIKCENLTLESQTIAGGFIGYYRNSTIAAGNTPTLTFNNCSFNNIYVVSNCDSGGLVGRMYARSVAVSGGTFVNSIILCNRSFSYSEPYTGSAGGLFGVCFGGENASNFSSPKSVVIGGSNANRVTISGMQVYALLSKEAKARPIGAGTVIGRFSKSVLDIDYMDVSDCTVAAIDGKTVLQKITLVDITQTYGTGNATFAECLESFFRTNSTDQLTGRMNSAVVASEFADAGGIIGNIASPPDSSPGVVELSIDNLNITGCSVFSNGIAGGVIGGAERNYDKLQITDCSVSDSTIISSKHSGGIIGDAYNLDNDDAVVFNGVSVSGTTICGNASVGGFVGYGQTTRVNIGASASASSSVTDSYIFGSTVGGVVGNQAVLTVNGITVTGNLITSYEGSKYAGGIAGAFSRATDEDTNSYSSYINNAVIRDNYIHASGNGIKIAGLSGYVSSGCSVYGNSIVWKNNQLKWYNQDGITIATFLDDTATLKTDLNGVGFSGNAGVWFGTVDAGASVSLLGVSRSDNATGNKLCDVDVNVKTAGSSSAIVYANYLEASEATPNAGNILTLPTFFGVLHGDAVAFDGSVWLPYAMNNTAWWQSKMTGLTETGTYTLYPNVPIGGGLIDPTVFPVFHVDGNTERLKEFVNSVTGGGFEDWDSAKISSTSISIVTNIIDGTKFNMTTTELNPANIGSVIYDTISGEFVKNENGDYDFIDTENNTGTASLLRITLSNPNGTVTDTEYTFDIILYYPKILGVTVTVKPIGYEEYNLDSYAAMTTPTRTVYDINNNFLYSYFNSTIVKGGIISTYIEFRYNDVYKDIADGVQFEKLIRFGNDTMVSNALPAGTKLTLIDLNTTNGVYSVYFYTTAGNTDEISWTDFLDSGTYGYVNLSELDDTSEIASEATENYLLVIDMPNDETFQLGTAQSQHLAHIQADIISGHGVKIDKILNRGVVTVWNSPTVTLSSDQVQNTVTKDDPLNITLTPLINYPDGFINAMNVANIEYYGNLRISITESVAGGTVTDLILPAGTTITLTNRTDPTEIYSVTADGHSHYIDILFRDQYNNGINMLDIVLNENGYSLTIDFSAITNEELQSLFVEDEGVAYNLNTNFYLTQLEDAPLSGFSAGTNQVFNLNIDNPVVLSVTVSDKASLGINLHESELDAYLPGRGRIDFTVYCKLPTVDTSATYSLVFKLQKKVWNTTTSEDEYVDISVGNIGNYLLQINGNYYPYMTYTLPVGTLNGSALEMTTDTLSIQVNSDPNDSIEDINEFTNYKLVIGLVKNDGSVEETVQSTYFIFTVSKLNTLIQ